MDKGTYLDIKTFFEYTDTQAFSDKKYHVADQVLINSKNLTWESAAISNVNFIQPVVVSNVDIKSGLAFYNCNFEGGIIFRGVTCLEFDVEKSKAKCSLYFSNCQMQHFTMSENCHFKRNVRIENNSEVELLKLFQSKVEETGFYFDRSKSIKFFQLEGFIGSFKISNSTFEDMVRFESHAGEISLVKSVFKKSIQIWNLSSRQLIFNDNTFEDTVKVTASRIASWSIIGDVFQKEIKYENFDRGGQIKECYLNGLYISQAKFIEGADIRGRGLTIDKITLPITSDLKGVLRIQNWHVAELDISGINQNLKLLLCQMYIRTLKMIEFTNYADVTFERCQAENELLKTKLVNSSAIVMAHNDLGATKFIEMDFRSFITINVENTSFDGIKCSNVNWFDDSQLVMGFPNNNTPKAYRTRREIYRQIKHALKSQGNQIDSLLFQAREMRAHRAELKSSKIYGYNDRLIMTVNMTNNYGLDWFKPFWIVSLITLGFYFVELPFFSDKLEYSLATSWEEVKITWSECFGHFNVYWQMFNPARKFEAVYGSGRSASLYFLDLFHRLVLGVFIFQIIRAFRKFSGK
ncbi:hypothetical protein ACFSYG_11515 [Leeuwenhoekiella polynyae]|uniref:Pentapeptide repeat protein n=1 Tax=Leeuwenhoekiella polynyae TaxID=1550906 RepID=A0A4Q0NVX6_9FLAO|nr:hypothetical protein [Leeuwenhoekiella polynyae]RXG15754.1 hypothetical protein DSM02_3295 [Leeuwenhoekiella polynyae]